MIGRLDERHHLDGGETRLSTALVVERADAHQTVRAALHAQAAIRIRRIHLERGRLDARFLGVRRIHHLGLEPVALAVAQVHAQQHLGEIGGIHATRAGADRHDRGTLVIFAVQQRLDLHVIQLLGDGADLGLSLAQRIGVSLLLSELHQRLDILDATVRLVQALQLRLSRGQAAGHLLRVLRIVPQTRLSGLGLQRRDLRLQPFDVQRLRNGLILRPCLADCL